MTNYNLKPIGLELCPHCDSIAFLAWYGGGYYKVRCSSGDCGAVGGSAQDPHKAAALWNRRKKDKLTDIQLAAVRGLDKFYRVDKLSILKKAAPDVQKTRYRDLTRREAISVIRTINKIYEF